MKKTAKFQKDQMQTEKLPKEILPESLKVFFERLS